MNATPEEKPDGAPEWMVSYADMITIMMSFFVIMFAIATGEAAKGKRTRQQQAAIDSLQYRFGPKWQPFSSWAPSPGNSPVRGGGTRDNDKRLPDSPGEVGGTVRILKHERARIRIPGHGERVVIGGVVNFDEGSSALATAQSDWLRAIAEELAGKPQQIEIAGHTSPRPLPPGSTFHDRWDLAYARCRQVARLLSTMGIEPERFRVSVAAATEAPAPGESQPEDARVDIFLTDSLAGRNE